MLRRSSFVELFLIFLPGLGFVSGNVSVRCPVGSRGFGVSLWSYLAAEVTVERYSADTGRRIRPICLSRVRISVHGELWAGLFTGCLRRLV